MRRLLITGVTSDIGIRFLATLVASGEKCIVWGTYRRESDRLTQLRADAGNVDLRLSKVDLGSPAEVESWLDGFQSEEQPSGILHLAADKFQYMRYRDFDWETVQNQMEIQLHSFIQITKKFLPSMVKNRDGSIVVMLTAYTLGVPPKFMSNYIMIKYALLGLVRSIASEYAGKGVRINAVSPNMIETKFLDNLDSRMVELNASQSAMRRNVQLEEVVNAIEFLLGEKSSYCNGVNLNLSGGDYM